MQHTEIRGESQGLNELGFKGGGISEVCSLTTHFDKGSSIMMSGLLLHCNQRIEFRIPSMQRFERTVSFFPEYSQKFNLKFRVRIPPHNCHECDRNKGRWERIIQILFQEASNDQLEDRTHIFTIKCRRLGRKRKAKEPIGTQIGFYMSERRIQKNNYHKFIDYALQEPSVVFEILDPSKPIEGQFDAIIHTVTDELVAISNSSTGTEDSLSRIQNLKRYLSENPQVISIDPVESQKNVLDRAVINVILASVERDVPAELGILMPKFLTVNESAEIYNTDGLHFPLVCKTVLSCGTSSSHEMGIAFNEKQLHEFQAPFIMQEFFNHNATSFKVYVLGDYIQVEKKKSLPNLPQNHDCVVFFDSQKPFKEQVEKALKIQPTKSDEELLRDAIIPSMSIISPLSKALSKHLGLSLFGYDLITQVETGKHAVIDINYFPNFMNMKDGPQKLLKYVVQRVQKQLES